MTEEQYLRFFEDLRKINGVWKWANGGWPQRPYPSAEEVIRRFNDHFTRTCEEAERVSNDL